MESKRFSSGTGRLTSDVLNYINDAADQVFNPPNQWEEIAWTGPILTKVIGSTEMGGSYPNRWLYNLQAVDLGSVQDMAQLVELSLGNTDGLFAINLAEAANTGTQAEGVTLSNLPTGFSLQPIPTGSLVFTFYRPFPYSSGSSDPNQQGFVAAFTQTNHFDGECS